MSTDARRFTVGGSDCAAAAGIHPYLSPVMLWALKTGRVEQPFTEAMLWGTLLERVVYAQLEADGYDLMPAPEDGFEDEWRTGHPDGFVNLDGRRCVLEVKTANQWAHRNGWSEDIPVEYAAQAQWYMALTGCDRTLVACLVAGQRLVTREVRRDDIAIGLLLDAVELFHGYLVRDECPPPDGTDSTRDALLALYPDAEPESRVRLDGAAMTWLAELRIRRAQRDALDAQILRLENELKDVIGAAQVAVSPADTAVIRWANMTTTRLDGASLKRDRPEIASEYQATTTSRRFTLL